MLWLHVASHDFRAFGQCGDCGYSIGTADIEYPLIRLAGPGYECAGVLIQAFRHKTALIEGRNQSLYKWLWRFRWRCIHESNVTGNGRILLLPLEEKGRMCVFSRKMVDARYEDSAMKLHDKIYIDGGWVSPQSTVHIDVINPANETVFARIAAGGAADVDRAAAAARDAFGGWSRLRFQPVDATHWLNRSAGVSKFNVSLGLSLSRLATALSLFW